MEIYIRMYTRLYPIKVLYWEYARTFVCTNSSSICPIAYTRLRLLLDTISLWIHQYISHIELAVGCTIALYIFRYPLLPIRHRCFFFSCRHIHVYIPYRLTYVYLCIYIFINFYFILFFNFLRNYLMQALVFFFIEYLYYYSQFSFVYSLNGLWYLYVYIMYSHFAMLNDHYVYLYCIHAMLFNIFIENIL